MSMTQRLVDLQRLLHSRFESGLQETIDWYRSQMPRYYFQVTEVEDQLRHLEVLHWMRHLHDSRLTMVDYPDSGRVVFFGKPGPDLLDQTLANVGDRYFHRLEFHSSRDGDASIIAFVYGDEEPPADFDVEAHRLAILRATCEADDCLTPSLIDRYLAAVDDGYLARSYPARVARHMRAWMSLGDPEALTAQIDTIDEEGQVLTRALVAGSMSREDFITNLARLLRRQRLLCKRAYLDRVPSFSGSGSTLIATVYLTDERDKPLGARKLEALQIGLLGLRRQFHGRLGGIEDRTGYRPVEFQILVAGIDFASQYLAAEHPFLDVVEVGRELIEAHEELCVRIANLVTARFGPKPRSDRWWQREYRSLHSDIEAVGSAAGIAVLEGVLTFVQSIQATNCFRRQRLGQAFRLDPAVLPEQHFPRRPYGLLFVHGSAGMGFHVRFQASARGGLRLLIPRTAMQLSRSRDRLLREVYELAWAQQLKNKDIPEGGSKCIGLVPPGGDPDFLLKMLTDGLLDLAVPAEQVPEIAGAYGAEHEPDLLFLGPDENMNVERITWVAERAAYRGLAHPLTFMSSKPGSGINHKAYGVTSEGIYTWVPLVLRHIGVGEDATWTLKMTGGPDGDVGGNLIKILAREQPDRCRIIAISDGTGCAYDPDGLAWQELLRLVQEGLGIARFQTDLLRGAGSYVQEVTDRESEQIRNDQHNQVSADLFVPCGGRPGTINEQNWRRFCDADGQPTARAMIEGANIFVTAGARDALQDAELLVVKDSSANKGGVICSSYEILAGLVLDEAEFVAIKDRYVAETIHLLRYYAAEEAEALLEAWRRRRGTTRLSDLSQTFSEEINRIAILLMREIDELLEEEEYAPIWWRELVDHCPPVLVERYGDRLEKRLPRDHRLALLAKHFASRMLYREGLTWCRSYVTSEQVTPVFAAYLAADREIADLERLLSEGELRDQPDTIEALAVGARRELVRRRLGL